MNQEHTRRQEIFKKSPEEKALLKKLKSEYKKKVGNGEEKRQHVLGYPEKRR